jgi:type 2 lantibiotic biosynthesis protein LanM
VLTLNLNEILHRAGTLREALLVDESTERHSINLAKTRLRRWCEVAAGGTWVDFERRLEWDGLSLERVRRVLGSVQRASHLRPSEWLETLEECITTGETFSSAISAANPAPADPCFVPGHPLPFEEALIPFIHVAREKLQDRVGADLSALSSDARGALERSLLQWMSQLCTPTLALEFSIYRATRQPRIERMQRSGLTPPPREHYQEFVKNLLGPGLLPFFDEYPVLARLLANGIDFWVKGTADFIAAVITDSEVIREAFHLGMPPGKISEIQVGLSDYHHQGRSVHAVTFSCGLKLVYKPRTLGIERAYFDLLAHLNERGIPLGLKTITVVDRSSHGWAEFVGHDPCAEPAALQRYYTRAGMLLYLTHVLCATDLHAENIIACGENPVLIDLETLMHPRARNSSAAENCNTAKAMAARLLRESVLGTNLLPRWLFYPDGGERDDSGFGGGDASESTARHPFWSEVNTDRMSAEFRHVRIPSSPNKPGIDGIRASVGEYEEALVTGFRMMHRWLIESRETLLAAGGPIEQFAEQEVRFIFRSTNAYQLTLLKANQPQYLRNGIERSIQLDVLSRLPLSTNGGSPADARLFEAEQVALEQMDVPYFTTRTNTRDLTISSGGGTVPDYFIETGFDSAVARLKSMSVDDLEMQIGIIRSSLESGEAAVHRPSTSALIDKGFTPYSLEVDEFVTKAVGIAESIRRNAIRGPDGSVTWVGPRYVHESQRFQIDPLGSRLYDGECGIALFFATLGRLTGRDAYKALAEAALKTLSEELLMQEPCGFGAEFGIGGALGYGSIVYGLFRVGALTDNSNLIEAAHAAAMIITPELISADTKLDVMEGTAGALLGLLALYQNLPAGDILDKAFLCGEHLLRCRSQSQTGISAWKTIDEQFLTGFSHGAAGISYSLARLFSVTGDKSFLQAAVEGFAYERSVFIPESKSWPDFRLRQADSGGMCAWCNGAAGIALGRIGSGKDLDSEEIRADIDAAIRITTKHGLGDLDHLCCGNLGRADTLISAAEYLDRPDLLVLAQAQAGAVLRRAEESGVYALHHKHGSFNPGLFQGLSGIGYELLRLAHPEKVPSVLLWS